MKRKLYFIFLALMSIFLAHAGGNLNYTETGKVLLTEYFFKLQCDINDLTVAEMSQFDNPEGWELKDVYAGKRCIYIKPGGFITFPTIPELTGNAQFNIEVNSWDLDYNRSKIFHLSIENGELSNTEFDGNSMFYLPSAFMYGVSSETRLTLYADSPIRIDGIEICYPNKILPDSDIAKYDPAPGLYHGPIDLKVSYPQTGLDEYSAYGDYGDHNFAVYTLDGTTPKRTSPRITGPIHLDKTTTVQVGTVYGNGALVLDKPHTYEFDVLSAPEAPSATYEINVTEPGRLKSLILDLDADVIEGLIIKGKINSEDLSYLSSEEGRVSKLTYLNMEDMTLDYDGGLYRTTVSAPEGGMGTIATYYYYLSETNYDENAGGGRPNQTYTNCYRNDLESAFGKGITYVVVPKALKSIGAGAFSGVESAIIPEGVEEIGNSAFWSARYVELPSSIRKIGDYVFRSLLPQKIDLPNLEYLGVGAFSGSEIYSFEFNDKLSHIGENAFSDTRLFEVTMTMPSDSIPARLFESCKDLKKVNIKGNVRYIGDNAFKGCVNIEEFNISKDLVEEVGTEVIPDYLLDAPEDGMYYIGKAAYKRSEDITECTIKEGTVSLAKELFNWSPLQKITLPSSLRKIGDRTFSNTKLTATPEMNGVVSIGDEAFSNCGDLARATIPESLQYMGYGIFDYCPSLWSLTYNAIELYECGMYLGNIDRIVIGDKVRVIPKNLFTRSNAVTEVTLPASVEVIADEAFSDCSNLKYVKSAGQIKRLGRRAFATCKSLEEISMLYVDSIPERAFYGCENLRSIKLSDNLKKFGREAFYGCKSLKDFYWPLKIEEIEYGAFAACESLEVISLPESVKRVEHYAFENCISAKNIYIPSSIINFNGGAFAFQNDNIGATVTCMLAEPPALKNTYWNFHNRVALAKVPAASLEAYKAHPDWAFLGDNIVPVEGISAPAKTTVTAFSGNINEDTDLSDTVIGDVYVTLGKEDSYDAEDGSIVLGSTIENQYAEILGGLVPGESDLANRFNGLVVKVGEGEGSVKIDCQTVGSNLLTVKMGTAKPQTFTKSEKGTVDVPYNVATPTYIYVYGTLPENSAKGMPAMKQVSRAGEEGCIRVYSMMISPNNAPLETEVENVTLNKTELTLTEGETATLTATILPEDATDKTVTWTSSDESVATVSNEGVVTAVKAGTATITAASANGKTAICTVTVNAKVIEVTEISISKSELTMTEGETATLTATVLPEDATDKTVTWTSSDEAVATVSNEGAVTAIKAGTATIIAASANGKTAICTVTVNAKVIEVTEISISQAELTLTEGETATLTATILPEDATDRTVTWTSSDEAVATVSSEGAVTAVSAGTANITAASANGKYATCRVTVNAKAIEVSEIFISQAELTLTEGETATLTATVMPENATDKTVYWTSLDESIATVSTYGEVNAVMAGTTSIVAATANGKYATCRVTVEPAIILVESLTISPDSWSGEEGSTLTITATVSPENATDKSLSWESSNESIATVDAEGNVNVLKAGTCTITVKTLDGSDLSAECLITGLSGIDFIFADPEAKIDVYNFQGILLKRNCSREDLERLQPAIYILRQANGKSTVFVHSNK